MTRIFRIVFTVLLALAFTDVAAFAQRNKANVRSSSRTSVSRERNVNVNNHERHGGSGGEIHLACLSARSTMPDRELRAAI